MKIKNKIAIGCLVQFYEIDIIEDYLKSVKYAREDIENKENIEVDICLNLNQGLEQLDESKINMLDIKERMDTLVGDNVGYLSLRYWVNTERIYTIADYR